MAEFCTCGSIVINGQCTNKNCSNKSLSKASPSKASKSGDKAKKVAKPAKTKRASKCIVYNMYENNQEENIN